MKSPEFTHAELVQLWHAVSEYADHNRAPETAVSARDKLDSYILSRAAKSPSNVRSQEDAIADPTSKDVHTEHCTVSGCKYGDSDCSVTTGRKQASFPDSDPFY